MFSRNLRLVTKKECRELHIGTRLAEFSFRELFSGQVDEIYLETRETTKNTVCKMGVKWLEKKFHFLWEQLPLLFYVKKIFANCFLSDMLKDELMEQIRRNALVIIHCHDLSTFKELSEEMFRLENGRLVGT